MKATLKQCADALRKHDCQVKLAADSLGITFQALYHRIKNHEMLQKLREEQDCVLVDIAEHALLHNLKEKDQRAVEFTLLCKGKDRGWVKSPDTTAIAIATLMDPAAAAAMIER